MNSIADEILLYVDGDVDVLINEITPQQAGYDFAMLIMGETLTNGYERLKTGVEDAGRLEGIDLNFRLSHQTETPENSRCFISDIKNSR